jgi:hypothetical protein
MIEFHELYTKKKRFAINNKYTSNDDERNIKLMGC